MNPNGYHRNGTPLRIVPSEGTYIGEELVVEDAGLDDVLRDVVQRQTELHEEFVQYLAYDDVRASRNMWRLLAIASTALLTIHLVGGIITMAVTK